MNGIMRHGISMIVTTTEYLMMANIIPMISPAEQTPLGMLRIKMELPIMTVMGMLILPAMSQYITLITPLLQLLRRLKVNYPIN
jgi:hypothetical protein